jgi:hypothetical protein
MLGLNSSFELNLKNEEAYDSIFKRQDEEYDFTPSQQDLTAISQLVISLEAYNGHRFESEGLLNHREVEV